MAILNFISNTVSISTTEISLINGNSSINSNTTTGIYQAFVDLNAMTNGDSYQFKIYEKTISGGTQRLVQEIIFTNAQGAPIYVTPALILMHGWDMSLKKLSGTDRSLVWSIRQIT